MSEQIIVAAFAALAAALADIGITAARLDIEGVSPGDLAIAGIHLFAMILPVGLACGIGVGVLLQAARSTRSLDPLRTRFSSAQRLFASDPEGFAIGIGLIASAAGFFEIMRRASHHFATHYHDARLASYAMAAVSLCVLVGFVLVTISIAWIVRPIARRMASLASAGMALVVLAACFGGVAVFVILRERRLLEIYDPVRVAWIPILAFSYFCVALLVRQLLRRLRSPWVLRVGAMFVCLGSAGALFWSALAYGKSSNVRTIIEHESAAGLALVRMYANATDRDRDGHAMAFGGGDCNDHNPHVYPGALDRPGDGVDADCAGGDGAPSVADYSDGAYGRVPPNLPRPNILLVTIDALRADHLGSYGYSRPVSPRIDAFARDAVQFNRVIAQSSRSIRSVPALFTGFYPSQIAYGPEYHWPALMPSNVTMTEVLRNAGYKTSVVMGTDYFTRTAHFFQGFQFVNQIPIYRPPRARPIDDALNQLQGLTATNRPWFLWVHLFNVHEPYLWDRTPSKFGPRMIDFYDTEITFADEQVGRLLDAVNTPALRDNTVVVIASDHGEAFEEHNNHGHSYTLYEEELVSPLLIRVPGIRPRKVNQTVALFDLMPTLLNLTNLPVPRPIPARSLVPLMTGEGAHPKQRLIFSEILPDGLYPYDQKAIRRGDIKLIWWLREGRFQLFDLQRDPREQRDLSDQRPKLASEMLSLLRGWVAETNLPTNRTFDIVERNRLQAPPAQMTHPMNVRVAGLFTVLGFDLPKTSFRPGERIPMTFYYRVENTTAEDYFLYVDIVGPPGYRVPAHFHAHHFPLNGAYKTFQWREGEILRDPIQMIIPETIPRPVKLRITFSVLDERRRRVVLEGDENGDRQVDLAEVDIL